MKVEVTGAGALELDCSLLALPVFEEEAHQPSKGLIGEVDRKLRATCLRPVSARPRSHHATAKPESREDGREETARPYRGARIFMTSVHLEPPPAWSIESPEDSPRDPVIPA